jgi:hypothetical protein
MPSGNSSEPREPAGRAGRSAIKIIPLTPGPALTPDERREAMRAAVVQVIGHLVVEAVPADRRSPHFDQARGLLDEAGWGLDELLAAAEPGPAREELFALIGLS